MLSYKNYFFTENLIYIYIYIYTDIGSLAIVATINAAYKLQNLYRNSAYTGANGNLFSLML